jgi:putative endonuclease
MKRNIEGSTHDTGDTAEHIAQAYLEKKGYTILDTNWRIGHLELDIVARNGQELVIVEVRSREGEGFAHPSDALPSKKINRIITAAEAWINFHGWTGDTRFDLILVTLLGSKEFELEHYDNAFNSTLK